MLVQACGTCAGGGETPNNTEQILKQISGKAPRRFSNITPQIITPVSMFYKLSRGGRQISTDIFRVWPTSTKPGQRPNLAKSWPVLAKLGQILLGVGGRGTTITQQIQNTYSNQDSPPRWSPEKRPENTQQSLQYTSGSLLLEMYTRRPPNFGRTLPGLVNIDPAWPNLGQC